MSLNLFGKAVVAGCAAVVLAAAPAVAGEPPHGADLRLKADHAVLVEPGGRTVLHTVVVNNGHETTGTPFTLTVSLPPGVFTRPPLSNCRPLPFGHTTVCTFPAGLRRGAKLEVDFGISAASGLQRGVLHGAAAVRLPGDPTPGDDTRLFDIVVG